MASPSEALGAPQELPQLEKMTKPERAFLEHVQARMARGETVWWRYQPFSLRLPHGDRYTPDYVEVERSGLIVVWEVKGSGGWKNMTFAGRGRSSGREGGRSRLAFHTAVEEYPFYRFRTAFQRKKKDGGGFHVEDHHPRLGYSRGTTVPPEEPTPGEVEDCVCNPTPATRSCFMHGEYGEELIHEPGCPAQKPALRCPGCVCECELRDRAWDPNTGRCRSCGLSYKEER